MRSVAAFLGLATASLVSLFVGALLAVSWDGVPRLIFAGSGFAGYLYFLAHALREVNLPAVLVEPGPDPERRRPAVPGSPAGGNGEAGQATRRVAHRFAA